MGLQLNALPMARCGRTASCTARTASSTPPSWTHCAPARSRGKQQRCARCPSGRVLWAHWRWWLSHFPCPPQHTREALIEEVGRLQEQLSEASLHQRPSADLEGLALTAASRGGGASSQRQGPDDHEDQIQMMRPAAAEPIIVCCGCQHRPISCTCPDIDPDRYVLRRARSLEHFDGDHENIATSYIARHYESSNGDTDCESKGSSCRSGQRHEPDRTGYTYWSD
mmetsp:Transcript_44692/g.142326  ORF Transcript_44692/g.142326 Transcript_44692/m.142326 type:complete len:225 (-) Transcript_44692:30-704(-)